MTRALVVLIALGLSSSLAAQAPQPEPQLPDPPAPQPQEPEPETEPEPEPQVPVIPQPDPDPPLGDPIAPPSADAGVADASPAQDPPPDESDDDELGEEHRPTLEVEVDPTEELMTGDVVHITIRVRALVDDDISVPSQQEFAPFDLLDTQDSVEAGDTHATHEFVLDLLALEPGEHELDPIRIRVLTPDGVIGEVETDAILIRVGSVLGNEPNAEPRPPTEPVQLLEDDPTLYWVAGILGVVLLTILFTLLFARWWRKREKAAAPPPPPRPAHEIALEKLDLMRKRRDEMLEEGEGVEFVDGVSDAVREYLGHRYGFDGLESTTDEVLAKLRQRKLVGFTMPEITGLLADCDLVKFAKAEFTLEQSDLLLGGAYHVVRSSTGRPEPAAAPTVAAPATSTTQAPSSPAPSSEANRWMPPDPNAETELAPVVTPTADPHAETDLSSSNPAPVAPAPQPASAPQAGAPQPAAPTQAGAPQTAAPAQAGAPQPAAAQAGPGQHAAAQAGAQPAAPMPAGAGSPSPVDRPIPTTQRPIPATPPRGIPAAPTASRWAPAGQTEMARRVDAALATTDVSHPVPPAGPAPAPTEPQGPASTAAASVDPATTLPGTAPPAPSGPAAPAKTPQGAAPPTPRSPEAPTSGRGIPDTMERPGFRPAMLTEQSPKARKPAPAAPPLEPHKTLPLGTNLLDAPRKVVDRGAEIPLPERKLDEDGE